MTSHGNRVTEFYYSVYMHKNERLRLKRQSLKGRVKKMRTST